jgi:hypothetical protein
LVDVAHYVFTLPNLNGRKIRGYDESGRRFNECIGVVAPIHVDSRPDFVPQV